jgi:Flp pilus assembly protein TadD
MPDPTVAAIAAAISAKDGARALTLARAAVAAQPQRPELWNALGVALRIGGKQVAAVPCYWRALELDPRGADAYSNLGNALKDLGRHAEAIDAHRAAIRLRPVAGNWCNLGVALRESNRLEEALAAYDEALRLEPHHGEAHFDRAQALLGMGDYERGWPAFEWRWKTAEAGAMPKFPAPLWDGAPLPGGTLLVWPEQGFGDSLLSARFLPLARDRVGRLLLGCKPPLLRLFSRLPGVDQVLPIGSPVPSGAGHCPIMGLPRYLMKNLDELPPPARLYVPAEARARVQPPIRAVQARLKVGIVWSGSVTFRANARRATEVSRFLSLAEVPGVRLFSLQMGPRAPELEAAGGLPLVTDLAPLLTDFADTAAAIEALDLVVMTDSAVAHLAGALGKPVWNLLPHYAYWLYLRQRPDSPWYPSMRLFRQPKPGDWDSVFAAVRQALAAL